MILGIDLGTTNSLAAVYKDNKPVIIESRVGRRQIPSVVSVDENGIFYAGDVAKERMETYPGHTVSAFKRDMGTDKLFQIGEKELKAEELSAVVLRNIKEDAEHFLGETIEEAVISVPAFFSNPQRKAVLRAGELAGFKVRQIINEPTAAAVAYSVNKSKNKEESEEENYTAEDESVENEEEKVLMVLDLGGGTFDISIIEVSGNIIEVVSVCGDNHLGGEDFTKILLELFLETNRINVSLSEKEKKVLWRQAENAKKMISSDHTGKMNCIIGGKKYYYEITEHEYERACFGLLEKMRKLSVQAVKDSGYRPEDISEILMTGGGMRLSVVWKMIQKMSGKRITYDINFDEAVVVGAAFQGCLLEKDKMVKDIIMTDICPYELFDKIVNLTSYDTYIEKTILLQRNTTIPAKRKIEMVTEHIGRRLHMQLYQSTGKYIDKETELGEILFIAPDTESGSVHYDYTIICDVNGIVKVELYIHENGYKKELILLNENCELTMEQAKERMEKLDYLKASPLEEEENKLVYARAERLYEEASAYERKIINEYMVKFESAIKNYDEEKISDTRKQLEKLLNKLEVQW